MDPSERGVVGSIIAFLSFLPILLDFGIAAELRRRLLVSEESLAVKVRLLGLATLPLSLAIGWSMSTVFFAEQSAALQSIVIAGSAVTPMLVLSAIDQSILLNREDYRAVLFTRLTQPLIYLAGVVISLLSNSLSAELAIWIVILGHFATGLVGALFTRLPLAMSGKVGNLLRAGRLFWVFGLGEFANARIDQILSIVALNHAEAGYYMVASIIIALPSAFVGTSIGANYYKRNSEFSTTGIWVANAIKEGILIGTPVILSLAIISTLMLPVVFGSQYEPAIPALLTGLTGSLFMILFTIASQLAASKNFLALLALSAWVGVTVDVTLLFSLGRFGAIGASIASSAGYAVSLVILLVALRIDFKSLAFVRSDIRNIFSHLLNRKASSATHNPIINFGYSDFAKTWKLSVRKFLKVVSFLGFSQVFKLFRIQSNKVFLESFGGSVNGDSITPILENLRNSNSRLKIVTANFAILDDSMDHSLIYTKHSSLSWAFHLATARVIVVNTNLPFLFKKRSGQTIFQTWHGTPLKKMGLDRVKNYTGARSNKSIVKDSKNWDYLLVSSEFTQTTLVRALDFQNTVLRIGLPRNDKLFHSGRTRENVRELLGVSDSELFVLYAPTWREEAKQEKAQFAFTELMLSLTEPEVILGVRAHGWSNLSTEKVGQKNFIDVSSYPDISDLYLAADVLLTDYSSTMFDFALTGKPIAFLLADLDEYEESRGLYIDLRRDAPGPIFTSGKDLPRHLKNHDFSKYKVLRRSWVKEYSSFENGEATPKIVEIIMDHLQ
jgi:CDP-glycerol glycerophosphotransferase